MHYELRNRGGWGGGDATLATFSEDDKDEAMAAGGKHIVMPGTGWQCPQRLVAVEKDGSETEVDCPDTFRCAECGDFFPLDTKCGAGWDEYSDPACAEPHTVSWVCEGCWPSTLDEES